MGWGWSGGRWRWRGKRQEVRRRERNSGTAEVRPQRYPVDEKLSLLLEQYQSPRLRDSATEVVNINSRRRGVTCMKMSVKTDQKFLKFLNRVRKLSKQNRH